MSRRMMELVVVVVVVSSSFKMVFSIHDTQRQKLKDLSKMECPLDAKSINPWLVKIWDVDYGLIMAHGSIVSRRAVLSTCSPFIDAYTRLSQYYLVGQNVVNLQAVKEYCVQPKKVRKLFYHEKCFRKHVLNRELWSAKFVDLAVWIVDGEFYAEGDMPVMKLPSNRATFLDDIRKLEAEPISSKCNLPVYTRRRQMDSYFPWDTSATLIPHSTTCLEIMCKDAADKRLCRNSNSTMKEGSRLCVRPKWKQENPHSGEPLTNWYTGSPLVCNGITYGISTFTINRFENGQGVHLIVSLLEHTPWIADMVKKSKLIEKGDAKKAEDTTPKPKMPTYDKDDYQEVKTDERPAERSSRAARNYHKPISAKFFIYGVIISCFLTC